MISSFILALREGLEAALIIGIVLGVLQKTQRARLAPVVWRGVLVAAGLSAVLALVLNLLGMGLKGKAEQIFEGIAMLLAAGILTWMIFWVQRQSASLRDEILAKTNQALKNGQVALFSLAFLAVFREGVELVLFLLVARLSSDPMQTLLGALAGLAGAALLGWLVFASTRQLPLKKFFQATNILLILFAAGLVGLGVHELNEAGWIPAVIEHVWNVNAVLDDHSEIGLVLKALFGYDGDPSLSEVIAYAGYLLLIPLAFRMRGGTPHKEQSRLPESSQT